MRQPPLAPVPPGARRLCISALSLTLPLSVVPSACPVARLVGRTLTIESALVLHALRLLADCAPRPQWRMLKLAVGSPLLTRRALFPEEERRINLRKEIPMSLLACFRHRTGGRLKDLTNRARWAINMPHLTQGQASRGENVKPARPSNGVNQ